MSGTDSFKESRSLNEALEAWGDPVLVAEMRKLKREGYNGPQATIFGGSNTDYDRKCKRFRELRRQLQNAVVTKLRNGELTATGYDPHAPIQTQPGSLPARLWQDLEPDFEKSSARLGTVEIFGIRIDLTVGSPGRQLAQPRLRISVSARQVRLDNIEIDLTHRSFRALRLLAEAALRNTHFLPLHAMRSELIAGEAHEKALAHVISRLKGELTRAGADRQRIEKLIENRRGVGYRLTLEAKEIEIGD